MNLFARFLVPAALVLICAMAALLTGGNSQAEDAKREDLRAAFPVVKYRPQESALVQLVERGGGLSDAGRKYLQQLSEFEKQQAELDAKIASGEIAEGDAVAKFAARVDRFQAKQIEQLPPIVFFTRHPLSAPNAANCQIWQSVPEKWGCSIRVLDPANLAAPAKTIFSDPDGCIFDMNLSWDARTVFFSFKKSDERCWQIYEIGVDGTGLKKISPDGEHYDIAATELPDGDLLFVSTRLGGYTLCQPGPASNLHVMNRDGGDIRCVSQNTLADLSPHLLPDGRVLFTRWEYIDRDLTYRQSLWTQNPDGRRYQLFFGNTIRDVGTFWQARPIPGHGDMVVATFGPHHGWTHGAIGLIHNRAGLEAPRDQGFTWITQEFADIRDRSYRWSYRDPFPISDYQFLVTYGGGGKETGKFALYLLDLCDNKTPLYSDPEMGCYNPLLVRERARPHQSPALARAEVAAAGAAQDEKIDQNGQESVDWGTVLVADVYQGMPEIERGRVKYIQVMEQMRKTADLTRRAYDQSPVMSYATYYAKKNWGRVKIESDGSAHFKVPALKEIYLQVLDEEGRELQRMTSSMQLMPGETLSCIGCHERRNTAPPVGLEGATMKAFARDAEPLELPAWGNDGVVDFVKVVQPVLNQYCVECHSGANPDGGYDLSDDKTRLFNMAYDNLLGRSRSYRQHDMLTGELLEREVARGKPLVHFFWLLFTPSAVNEPLTTGSHASRLLEYVDTDHCGKMIPREDRERIYNWIDANVPYYGTYDHSRPLSPGYRDLCTDVETGQESEWFKNDFLGVYNKQCRSCHDGFPHPNDFGKIWSGRMAWINFSHPEWSPALTAHLAKEAGGRNLGTEKDGTGEPLYKNTEHPDYVTMLKAIRQGREQMLAHPRVDMAVDGTVDTPAATQAETPTAAKKK